MTNDVTKTLCNYNYFNKVNIQKTGINDLSLTI